MSVKVTRTSVFPESAEKVFARLQKLSMLQMIASLWVSFTPSQAEQPIQWKKGAENDFLFRLFGVVPFGTSHFHVIRFRLKEGNNTQEQNSHVPIWNHEIILQPIHDNHCSYTDQAEIDADWKTLAVWIWDNRFFVHRQIRWMQMSRKNQIWHRTLKEDNEQWDL